MSSDQDITVSKAKEKRAALHRAYSNVTDGPAKKVKGAGGGKDGTTDAI